jgi:putative FmdB family regulatory protein
MPLYEYRCQACGQQVTLWQSFSATDSPSCPACGHKDLTRLISRVSVVKSAGERTRDLSWVDRNLAQRIEKNANTKLNPNFREMLNKMDSN